MIERENRETQTMPQEPEPDVATGTQTPSALDAASLKGMAIVTLAEAERIGRVDDVLFETMPLRAAALLTRDGRQQRVVAMSAVRRIGADAIVTDDAETAREPSPPDHELRGLEALRSLKVVDETGSYVGHITRIEVDPASGDVTNLELRRGEVLGVGGETTSLNRDAVMGVGPELITVRAQ